MKHRQEDPLKAKMWAEITRSGLPIRVVDAETWNRWTDDQRQPLTFDIPAPAKGTDE